MCSCTPSIPPINNNSPPFENCAFRIRFCGAVLVRAIARFSKRMHNTLSPHPRLLPNVVPLIHDLPFPLLRFSWSTILLALLKMIRRLFTTFVDLPAMHTATTPAGSSASSVADSCIAAASGADALANAFRSPAYESLNWLHREAPCFPVSAANIRIITEPAHFYEALSDGARAARSRIVLASLYLGTGEQEHALVARIRQNLRQNPRLRVNVLLDFARGTRGADRGVSSKDALMPLLQQQQENAGSDDASPGSSGSSNVCVSLYHTPALRGLSKRLMPPRWNELIGLQHMKLYVFDDTVIVSGANMSRDYFTNRQDRYIVIEDRRLADFYARLVGRVQEFSFQVQPSAELRMPGGRASPCDGGGDGGEDFARRAREQVLGYFAEVCEQQQQRTTATEDGE